MANVFDDLDVKVDTLKPGPPPSYLDRIKINFEAAQHYATIGQSLMDVASPEQRRRFDLRYEAFPQYDGFLEGAAALAGQLGGAAWSPENFIPIGAGIKAARLIGLGASQIRARVVAGAVDSAVVNTAIDPVIQGLELGAGFRDDFSFPQLGASIAIGTFAGGVFGGAIGGVIRTKGAIKGRPGSPDISGRAQETVDDIAARSREAETESTTTIKVGDRTVVQQTKPEAIGDVLSEAARGRMIEDEVTPIRAVPDEAPVSAGPRVGSLARDVRGVATVTESKTFVRLRDVSNRLADVLGVAAVRQGRITAKVRGKKGAGQFSPRTGVIRVKSQNDFDVFTHEVGHHVDRRIGTTLKPLIDANSAEVGALAYPGTKAGRETREGFAEYFRLLLTHPEYASRVAPVFDAQFRGHLADKYPDMDAAIREAQTAYREWVTQPSGRAVESIIVSSVQPGWLGRLRASGKRYGLWNTIADQIENAYAFLFDDVYPIQRSVRALLRIHKANTGKTLDLKTTQDSYKLARLSRAAFSSGHMDIIYGIHAYGELNPSSPSLRDAIIESMGARNILSKWDVDRVRSFDAYLWGRRALGEWDRFDALEVPNAPDSLSRGDHEVRKAELEALYPEFITAADRIYAWNQALWRKKRDAGLITDKQYTDGLRIKDYVPGQRDFTFDGDPGLRPVKRGRPPKTPQVYRYRGSKRDVISPLESMMADAYETAMAIARNDVIKQLDRLALLAGEGGGAIAERIPSHELRAIVVDPLAAISAAAKQAGLSEPDALMIRSAVEAGIGDEKVAIFRPAIINERGEAIVFFRDAGELKALRLADGEFGRQMYRALTTMSRTERHIFIEMLSTSSALLRTGVVTSPEFLIANFIRDQAMAAFFYGKPLRRIYRSLHGMADEVFGQETSRKYNARGGIMGGAQTAALRNSAVERDLRGLRRRGWSAQRLGSLKGLLEIAELSETGMRLGLFRTFYDEARKRGLSDFEAATEAAYRARDFIDFDRRGSGMTWIRTIPFLGASLQGIDKGVRQMILPFARKVMGETLTPEDNRAMGDAIKTWARVGVATIATMGLHASNSRYPEYEEISGSVRAKHWAIKTGDKWSVVPKPFEIAAILNLGEAAWDAMVRHDPTAGSRYLDGLWEVLAPPSVITGNPAVSTYFEIKTNTDLFSGAPIVPEHLQGIEPHLQFTARTSAFAKQLGGAVNLSPAIIDHIIVNSLGTWGGSLLAMYDIASGDKPAPGWDDMPIIRRFIKDASKGSTSTRAFWDLISERTGEFENSWKSYRIMIESGDTTQAADYLARMQEETRVYVTAQSMPADANRLHPLTRARLSVQTISNLRREISFDRITDRSGDTFTLPAVERGAADDILATLAMAEARNALHLIKVPGWAHREPMDISTWHRELEALSPQLFDVLADRFASARVVPYEGVVEVWPEYRQRLLEDGSDAIMLDLRAQAESAGYELGGFRVRPTEKPVIPGIDPGLQLVQ